MPMTVLQVLLEQCLLDSLHHLQLSSSIGGGTTPSTQPCGVLARRACCGQSMYLEGSPDSELGSGFSANLTLFLWLRNHIVLVAKKPFY